MLTDNLTPVGKLTRVHGVEGKAIVVFENWALENLKKTEWVFLKINGLPVPFFISNLEILTSTSAIISLEGIESVEQMRPHLNREVLIEWQGRKKSPNVQSIIGYDIFDDENKILGKISDISDFNGNIVAHVTGEKGVLMIPLNEETLIKINSRKKCVFVKLPDGLIELYLKS